ncbi:hypothetical protein [Flavobacterium microcysteis]
MLLLTYQFLTDKSVRQPSFGFLFIAIAVVINYTFFKNAPKIIVNKNGIKVGKKQYFWEDSLEIEITGKGKGFIHSHYEATKIFFKNQKVVYVFENYYDNSPEIRSFINQIVINKKETFLFKKVHSGEKDLSSENFKTFKGHPIFSLRGLMTWGLILFVIFLFYSSSKKIEPIVIAMLSAFCTFWFLLNSWMSHYFQISNNYLIVKNHYFFWIKKVYQLDDIREVVYDQQGKQSNALRIITKDFESSRFIAGTLYNKHWLEMIDCLKDKNIKVRNECI